jgi:hypothetical protein
LCNCDHRRHMEAQVETLLGTIIEDSPVKFWPCDISEEIQSLKSGKACSFDGIPNEWLWHLPRRPLVHFTHLFNHCLQLDHFPVPWKEAEIITLLKPSKDPKFLRNLRPISLLSTTCKLFEKLILRTIQKAHWGKKLIEFKSFWLSSRSQYDTSMYEAGGLRHPKF